MAVISNKSPVSPLWPLQLLPVLPLLVAHLVIEPSRRQANPKHDHAKIAERWTLQSCGRPVSRCLGIASPMEVHEESKSVPQQHVEESMKRETITAHISPVQSRQSRLMFHAPLKACVLMLRGRQGLQAQEPHSGRSQKNTTLTRGTNL
jgi:hypothetical protein